MSLPIPLTALLAVFSFLLGCVFASFGGVVIDRVPKGGSIVSPPSRCDSCGHKLKWYENIPLLSFLLQKGKCRECGEPIGAFFFVYELIGGVGFALIFLRFGVSVETPLAFAIFWLLAVMAGIDYREHNVYDGMQVAYLILSAGFAAYRWLVKGDSVFGFLIGGAVGFFSFLLIKGAGRVATKRECLGMGDVIFMGISGVLLGWKSLLFAVLIASVGGAVTELLLIKLRKRERDAELAFVPYLALGVLVALLYGEGVIGWYLKLVA